MTATLDTPQKLLEQIPPRLWFELAFFDAWCDCTEVNTDDWALLMDTCREFLAMEDIYGELLEAVKNYFPAFHIARLHGPRFDDWGS